ncbi:MAG: hypothetical protein K8F59_16090 [Rhodobacteraceae bacterium]|nr:hypothetical protein [Paracoccaceae bacterium]
MDYLDVRVSELVNDQDKHLLRASQQYGWRGLWRLMLRSRLGSVVKVIFVIQFVVAVAAIWTAIQFFQAVDVLTAVKYGISAATLVILLAMLQLAMMPHMHAERLIRAMKRMEILLLSRTQ